MTQEYKFIKINGKFNKCFMTTESLLELHNHITEELYERFLKQTKDGKKQ